MTNTILVILVALFGGVAAVIQAQLNGVMDKGMGTLESVFITYGIGGIAIALIMLFRRGGNLRAFSTIPWYVVFAGLCGLVIIGALSFTVPRLGLVAAITILVATQFILGAVFDHFGIFGASIRPLTLQKFTGIGVLMLGVWLIIR
jgi:transporter family-2 protein